MPADFDKPTLGSDLSVLYDEIRTNIEAVASMYFDGAPRIPDGAIKPDYGTSDLLVYVADEKKWYRLFGGNWSISAKNLTNANVDVPGIKNFTDGLQAKGIEVRGNSIYASNGNGNPNISDEIKEFSESNSNINEWFTVNISSWPIMQLIPSSAKWVRLYVKLSAGSTTLNETVHLHAKKNGGSYTTVDDKNEVVYLPNFDTSGFRGSLSTSVKVPIASRAFDLYLRALLLDSFTLKLRLDGYGW